MGRKETVIGQLMPGSSDAGHWLVWLNPPWIEILTSKSGALPTLLMITVCGVLALPTMLANGSEVEESFACGARTPVPDNGISCTVPPALSRTVTLPILVPAADGAKLTSQQHDEAPAHEPFHLVATLRKRLPLATIVPLLNVASISVGFKS